MTYQPTTSSKRVKQHIRQAYIQERFYNIPSVENMIAARQLIFIGKVVRYPSYDWPGEIMLTSSCNNSKPEQGGRPQYHNKYALMSNPCLLFENYMKCILTLVMEL